MKRPRSTLVCSLPPASCDDEFPASGQNPGIGRADPITMADMSRLAILSGRLERLMREGIIPPRLAQIDDVTSHRQLVENAAVLEVDEDTLRDLLTERLLAWLLEKRIKFHAFEDDPRLYQFATRSGEWTEPRQLFEGCILAFDEFYPLACHRRDLPE
jgi:hypothetical protein